MSKLASLCLAVSMAFGSLCQTWQWTEMRSMPFATSNNTVCEAVVGGNEYMYSFGGIGAGKTYADIHSRSFKYTVSSDTWTEIDPLPDTESKIASGASFVKGKVYILGGYHVYSNGSEVSSNKVHIYNPQTDAYEADGVPIPVPIDDHVQCVYKDSLIVVVTGWSNTGNVPNVQIYNPSLNSWQVGTSVPNTLSYIAFGASGYIVGDTIYYHGGATGGSFNAQRFLRKGLINPSNPIDITWFPKEDAPGVSGYRSACSGNESTVFWLGGSSVSYNYNGIAYNGSGGVAPSARVLHLNSDLNLFTDETAQPFGVMDLRGIAKFSGNRWMICGGMDSTQTVTARTFLLESNNLNFKESETNPFLIKQFETHIEIETKEVDRAKLVDLSGKLILELPKNNTFRIDKSELEKGIYLFIQGNNSIRIRI